MQKIPNFKAKIAGSAMVSLLILTTSIGAAYSSTSVGIGLLTASVLGIGVILGTTIRGKREARISA